MTLRDQYEKCGFAVVDSGIPEATLLAAREATGPLQPKRYHWNPAGRRTFEGWKSSQAVRDCVYAPNIVNALVDALGLKEAPRPVQTINFDRPSLQKLHGDYIHFDTYPERGRMVGVWLALEDVDESNGTLAYVPGTHRMPAYDWNSDMDFPRCKIDEQYEHYAEYEERMERIAEKLYGGKVPFRAKMGQAFVWGLNMLHGGWPAKDPLRTRHSMVTHYALPDAGRLWAPMFSDTRLGEAGIHFKSSRWFDRAGHLHELSRNRS